MNREVHFGKMPSAIVAVRSDLWRRVRTLLCEILRLGHRPPRRLRLCESLPLGERRFVAVIEFERSRFLVGGTPSSLVLLSPLEDKKEIPIRPINQPNRVSGEEQL